MLESGPKMTPELSLLFGGRTYDTRTLFLFNNQIDSLLKTDKICPYCTGLDNCKMPARGWQTFFDSENADMYRLPSFRIGQCHHQRREYLDESVKGEIAPKFQQASFLSFKVVDDNREAFNKVKDYADYLKPEASYGLLLIGPTGTGKTHLATAVLRTAQARGIDYGFVVVTDLLNELRPGGDGDGKLAESVKNKTVLLLDDLGTDKPSDWVSEQLYRLINHRNNHELPTLITSNYKVSELKTRLGANGDKIVDRIQGMCETVVCTGKSWRRKR
jgi:DNA replication protein DnaC